MITEAEIQEILNELSTGSFSTNTELMGYIIAFFFIVLLLLIFNYVYTSFMVMKIAKRLGEKNPGYAWIPLVGKPLLMSKMAKMPWWPLLFMLGGIVPIIGQLIVLAYTVFYYVWWWKVTERRGLEGWLVLLTIIPLLGWIWAYVLLGMLAYKKD